MEEPHIQVDELELIARMVRQQLEGAKEAGLVIPEQVYRWLEEAHEIFDKIDNPNVFDEKANLSLRDIVDRGKNISWVDFPVDTQGIELLERDDFVNFNSRRDVFERIMLDLKNKEGGVIGLFGMGGIGKTKLVMEIGNKVKHHQLFNEVVMVTVTQYSDSRNIQEKLANALNLRLGAFSEEGRSNEIQTKIKTKTNILFILDNLLEKIDTEHIGIPLQSEDNGYYRIIITSRSKGVCENMGCISPICLQRIDDEEAVCLFIKHACLQEKQPDMKIIVDECGGLPLAVVTVGRALRSKGLEEYRVAAPKLSRSNFVNIKSTEREIYACLKLSYDYLDDVEAQKCFLLCSLFPEDNKIEVEELTRYAYGHGLFEDVESVNQARQKMIACVTKLEDAGLLSLVQDCCIGVVDVSTVNYLSHVKMHDLVRDVAIWIAKWEGVFTVPDSLKQCDIFEKPTAVYLNSQNFDEDDDDCPQELAFPNLKILITCIQSITFPENFFKTVRSLQVLDYGFVEEKMPASFKYLVNLKVLRVYGEYLRDKSEMFTIQNFKKLEILEISFAIKDMVLPIWIGELCSLRVLDLSRCFYLEQIPRNVIKKLTKLEELYTPRYHKSNCSHALLEELIHLPCLSVLTGWFAGNDDFKDRKQNMVWSMLWNNNQYWRARMLRLDDFNEESMKILKRLLPGVGCLDIGMKFLPGIRNLCSYLGDSGLENLSKLRLSDSMSLEFLIDTTTFKKGNVLPNLLELSLSGMKELRRVCDVSHPDLNILANLASLGLENCPRIEYLVPDIFLIAPKLEKLYIRSCGALTSLYHHVYTTTPHQLPLLSCELDDAEPHTLMTLEAMLINLTSVDIGNCNKVQELFPFFEHGKKHCNNWKLTKLATLTLLGLPKLKCIWKAPQQIYRLLNLKTLYLSRCDKLCSVFTPLLAQSLGKLESLVISKCAMLETIVSAEDELLFSSSSREISLSFPKLRILCVNSCNKLKNVLPMAIFPTCMPKLEHITLKKCEVLQELFGADQEYSKNQTQDIMIENRISLELMDLPNLDPFSEFVWNQMLSFLLTLKISGTTFKQASDIVSAEAQHISNAMLPIRAAVFLREMKVDSEGFFSSANEIFDGDDAQESILTGLRLLKLGNMLKLQHLWKGPSEFNSLCNLEKIYIHDCPAIKTFFPHSFCLSLHSLKSLKVDNCKQLKSIFDPSDDAHINNEPCLHGKCFPKLNKVRVHNCPVLETIFPVCVASNFPCLKSYEVEGCPMLENISISGSGFHVRIT